MHEILWLDSAINDLECLRKLIAVLNPIVASKLAKAVRGAADDIQNFPLIGKPVNELEGFYDLFIEFGTSGYYLRYRLLNEKIYVVHIKHPKELNSIEIRDFKGDGNGRER